ncbi:MAG: restriction endonuclease [Sphingobium sp.]
MTFNDLVGDWGGFERLVATLHETGDVMVERDVALPGRSGAPRQIDVLIRHRQGLYEHLVVVECKYWRSAVERLHVDALATTVREVGASKGVIFSSSGFQSGAITQAEHDNIDLFLLRDLAPSEWGRPGRIVDLFLQVAQIGLGGIKGQGAFLPQQPGATANPDELRLDIRIIDGKPESSTSLIHPDGASPHKTLEECILQGLNDAAQRVMDQGFLFNGGAPGTYFLGCPVTLNAPGGFHIPLSNGRLSIAAVELPAALKIVQSRITLDRAKDLEFALAVESKITGEVSLASRETGSVVTHLQAYAAAAEDPDDPPMQNGQVMSILLNSHFDIAEMANLSPVLIDDVRRPVSYTDPKGSDCGGTKDRQNCD